MRNKLAAILGVLGALVGVSLLPAQAVVAPVAVTTSPFRAALADTTDYGSGTWGGPVGSPLQTANWTDPNLVVGIVGDSITMRCYPKLQTRLAATGRDLAVYAYSGQNTQGLVNWAVSLTYKPDLMILAGGTNNIFDPPNMAAQISRMKADSPTTNLVWVDTYAARVSQTAAVQLNDVRNSGWVNQQIHAAFAPDHVVDWNANLGATIGRGLPISYYLQDGVHPWNGAGTGHGDGCDNWAVVIMNTISPLL